jgi:hypothetical protein
MTGRALTWSGAFLILASPALLLLGALMVDKSKDPPEITPIGATVVVAGLASLIAGLVCVVQALRIARRDVAAVQSRFEDLLRAEIAQKKEEKKP